MIDVLCEVAPYCLEQKYVAASELTGFLVQVDENGRAIVANPAATHDLGVKIQFVANDSRQNVDGGTLRETCVGAACVVFRVECEDLVCSWIAAPLTSDQQALSEVRIIAASQSALRAAKDNLWISVATELGEQRVSLSQLGDGSPARPGFFFVPDRYAQGR